MKISQKEKEAKSYSGLEFTTSAKLRNVNPFKVNQRKQKPKTNKQNAIKIFSSVMNQNESGKLKNELLKNLLRHQTHHHHMYIPFRILNSWPITSSGETNEILTNLKRILAYLPSVERRASILVAQDHESVVGSYKSTVFTRSDPLKPPTA